MMPNRKILLRWADAAVVLFFCGALTVRCASIMTPEGGPRDTLPPRVVAATPADYSTGFKERRIYISFDEFVQLKDQQKEFFTSPAMKKKPTLTVRGRGIMIQIRDTLKENTTYALNFGSSVRDNNEGNPLNGMRYVFSTGPEVDSMIVSGYTADGYTSDSVSKSYIWFYRADSVELNPDYDSTMFNRAPDVIARAENNGIFLAQNLKPIPYRVYAYEDTNDNQMYEPGTDRVGYLDSLYNPAELPDFSVWYDSLRLYLSAEPQLYIRMSTDRQFRRQILSKAERPKQHCAMLYFGAEAPRIDSIVLDSIPSDKVIVEPMTRNRDTLALWFDLPAEQLPDTIRGRIVYMKHDSVRVLQRVSEPLKLSWRYIESKEEAKAREREERARAKAEAAGEEYKAPPKENPFGGKLSSSGEVNPERGVWLDVDYPLRRLDTARVELIEERVIRPKGKPTRPGEKLEAKTEEVRIPVRMVRDTASLRRWHLDVPWQEATKYRLTIPAGAIEDIAGQQNDTISSAFTTYDPEKFATVKLRLKSSRRDMHYIAQLLDGSGRMLKEYTALQDTTVEFRFVPAGDIRFRLVEDANDNGRWDSGDVIAHRQPERSEIYADAEGQDTFATKVNWEFEVEMDMDKLFAPVTMQSLIEMLDRREMIRLQREAEKRAQEEKEGRNRGQNRGNSNRSMGPAGGMGGGMGSMNPMGNMRNILR